MSSLTTFVALLRGINVGGRNVIAMAQLRALFTSLGFEDVATYIQSGNVVFRSASADSDELTARIENAVAEALSATPTVILRVAAELEGIAARNPYVPGSDVGKLHVVLLRDAPGRDAAATLDPDRSPADAFALEGREIYLRLPNGAGRSKLTIDYFERALGVPATQRNWNTLLRLIEMTRGS
jgi:uncharacterized protein (DUF1697 family)